MKVKLLTSILTGLVLVGCTPMTNPQKDGDISESTSQSEESIVDISKETSDSSESNGMSMIENSGRSMTLAEMENYLIGVWEHETDNPNELDEWFSFNGEKQSNVTWWETQMAQDKFELQFNSWSSYYISAYNESERTILVKTESIFGDPYENTYTFSEFGNEMTHHSGKVFKRLGGIENAERFYENKSGNRYLPSIQ